MIDLSLVIPCYNEAPTLERLVTRVAQAMQEARFAPECFELLCVDNGSTDGSRQVLEALAARPEFSFLRVVGVDQNRGYGHGVMSGLRAASGAVLATTHADLQTDPADVFGAFCRYVRLATAGPVLVKGVRSGRPLPSMVVSRLFEVATVVLVQRLIHEINAQPKVFSRDLLDALTDPPDDFRLDLYLMLRALDTGHRVATVPVRFPPREHGQSNWSATVWSRWRTFAGFLGYLARYRLDTLRP